MIRLLASDMDGTLLTSQKRIHPDNLAAIRELVASGVVFCLATGRGISTIRPYLQELGCPAPIVSSNGAKVLGSQGESLHDSVLPNDAVAQILDYAEAHGIHVNSYHDEEIRFSQQGEFADLYRTRTGCEPVFKSIEELRAMPATKLLYVGHPEHIAEHTRHAHGRYAELGISVVTSEPDYLEFLPPGIHKGLGLQHVATSLGFDQSEVAAIGDWTNDVEMLEWAGLSACVANAAPEVKAVAQMEFASNDEGGVADFIRYVMAQNNKGILSP